MTLSDDFFRGILTALEILAIHDERTIFDEIVQSAGEKDIIRVARSDGEMRRSGLTHYGYGRARDDAKR